MRYLGAAALAAAIVMADAGGTPALAQQRPAGDPEVTPHRAVYTLSLGRTRQGSNISGAKGALVMEWAKSCEGWTVKQRLKLDLIDNEGKVTTTEADFSSFEAHDGLSYRFTSRDSRGGRVVEDLQGSARLAPGGGPGTADFTQPEGLRFDLPAGTVFPTAHMQALLAAARAGERVLYRVLFDGAGRDGPLGVNAVIGRIQEKAQGAAAREPLTNRRSWAMRLAYFPLGASKAEPTYELGLRAYDNGVSEDYVIDYGGFAIDGKLERIEALERPKC